MAVLYVISPDTGAGKTTLCAGLARYLRGSGKKVGFLKTATGPSPNGALQDAAFMKRVLDLPDNINATVAADAGNMPAALKEAIARETRGMDVVLVEGVFDSSPGSELSKASFEAAKAVNARVIAVETYSGASARFTNLYKDFGPAFLGVIVNKVPASRIVAAKEDFKNQLDAFKIRLLGVIPEDRQLLTLTVADLAGLLNGKILNIPSRTSAFIENIMVGAMHVDSGLSYYGRKPNKAAIIRSDRPDMQLAALETSTSCLLLSGTTAPLHSVIFKAENKGVSIVSTESPIEDIITKIESALDKARLNQMEKLPRLTEVIQKGVDIKILAGVIAAG